MRRQEREIKDEAVIQSLLDKAHILHLAMFDTPYPYIVPLHYAYRRDEEGLVFYTHGAKEGYKWPLLQANPHVCLEIDTDVETIEAGDVPCMYSSYYLSLIGRGRAQIVEDKQEKVGALRLLMQQQVGRDFSFSDAMVEAVAVLKITIDSYSVKGQLKDR